MNKILIPVIAVLLLLVGGWYWYRQSSDIGGLGGGVVADVLEEGTMESEPEDEFSSIEEAPEAYEDERGDAGAVTPPASRVAPKTPSGAAPTGTVGSDLKAIDDLFSQEFTLETQTEDNFATLDEAKEAYEDEAGK